MLENLTFHRLVLSLIALAFLAKVVSLIFFGELHANLKIIEFFSIAVYFFYIGWLGFMKLKTNENNGRYMVYATFFVILDIIIYYFFKGWV